MKPFSSRSRHSSSRGPPSTRSQPRSIVSPDVLTASAPSTERSVRPSVSSAAGPRRRRRGGPRRRSPPGRPIAARASTQGSALPIPPVVPYDSGHARAPHVRHLRRGERRVPGRSRPVGHLHRVAFTGGRSYGRDRVRARHPGRRPRARHRGDDRGVGAAGLLGDRVQRRQVRRRRVSDLPRHPQGCASPATSSAGPDGGSRASGCSGRASSSTASTRRRRCSSSPSCRSSSTPTAARSRRR